MRRDDVAVVAATRLEAWAVRYAARDARIVRAGVALGRLRPESAPPLVVTCGLAGAMGADLSRGAVVVPTSVAVPGETAIPCDPRLSQALIDGARALGLEAVRGPMITVARLAVGEERAMWREQGYIAADMETGALLRAGVRAASVRVILDTPAHDIGAGWERPLLAVLRPSAWGEAARLARDAPAFSLRAARVLAAGLRCLEGDLDAQVEA